MKYLQQSQHVQGILVCIQQHTQLCIFLSIRAAYGQRKLKRRKWRNFSSLALEDWVL